MEAEVGHAPRGSADPGLIDPRPLVRAVARSAALGAGLLAGVSVLAVSFALAQHSGIARAIGGIVGLPVVGILALVVGGVYGSTRALRRQLPVYEAAIGRVLQPLVAQLVRRLDLPAEGLGADAFERLLDRHVARLSTDDASLRQPWFRRAGIRLGVRLIRATVARRFLAGVRDRGERVTTDRAEGFARERLVTLLMTDAKGRLAATHYGAAVLAGILVLGPLVWLVVARAR